MSISIPISSGNILALIFTIAVLYVCALHDYIFFHTLAEFFSIVIAFGIFTIAWNSRKFQKNQYLLFLGIAFLFVGAVDMAHTLTYKGMMIFQTDNADTPTQLWIIARYMESISLFIAPVFFNKKLRLPALIIIYTTVTGLLLWAVHTDLFPRCFVEGAGLTPFKKISEYIISAILAGALFTLYAKKEHFNPGIFKLLTASIVLTIGSELAFSTYMSVYGPSNLVGHLLKFISFYLIYKALVETGLKEPYEFLFRDLAKSEKQYRSLFNNMLNGFAYHRAVLDENRQVVDHIFMEVNDAFEKIIGLPRKEVVGRKITEVFPGIREEEFDFIGEFGKVALSGKTFHTEQYFEVNKKWYSFSAYSPQRGYCAIVFDDITDRKLAEQAKEAHLAKVNSLMVELERSNQELQQFANTASHDLLEPLRTVTNFVQLLKNRYQGALDDRADTYINFIAEGTERMHRLLNDLLAFARLGGGQLQLKPLELCSVLNKAVMNLSGSIEKKQAEINCSPHLPQIIADETQMIQLFQNLLANSLKFSGSERPKICVSAKFEEKQWVVCVKDNGIGIDPQDISRIFHIFQRLHPRKEYEGTGIGLAQCKKIVERHGGKIWAESSPGRGSSFYFSLPEQDNMKNFIPISP